LNVIPYKKERQEVLSKIKSLLTDEGVAYISVRADKKNLNGYTKTGSYQEFIELDLPIVKKTSSYLIYELRP